MRVMSLSKLFFTYYIFFDFDRRLQYLLFITEISGKCKDEKLINFTFCYKQHRTSKV